MRACIVTPTYNEKENISTLLDRLLETFKEIQDFEMHILVVDDNSPDKTFETVLEYNKENPNIHLLLRNKKQGLGAAYIQGLTHAITQLNADIVIQMDADLSHPPELLPKFLDNIKQYDLVIGSRYIEGGGFKNWPKHRKIISRGANIFGQLTLGLKVKDISSGYRCYRKEVIQKINFEKFKNFGYSFLEELLFFAIRNKARTKEIPLIFIDRTKGNTKLNKKEMMNFFTGIIDLRLKNGKA